MLATVKCNIAHACRQGKNSYARQYRGQFNALYNDNRFTASPSAKYSSAWVYSVCDYENESVPVAENYRRVLETVENVAEPVDSIMGALLEIQAGRLAAELADLPGTGFPLNDAIQHFGRAFRYGETLRQNTGAAEAIAVHLKHDALINAGLSLLGGYSLINNVSQG